jgi:hypothetical protein
MTIATHILRVTTPVVGVLALAAWIGTSLEITTLGNLHMIAVWLISWSVLSVPVGMVIGRCALSETEPEGDPRRWSG